MNYRPSVVAAGGERYRAQGLMFHMPGRWVMTFELSDVRPGPPDGRVILKWACAKSDASRTSTRMRANGALAIAMLALSQPLLESRPAGPVHARPGGADPVPWTLASEAVRDPSTVHPASRGDRVRRATVLRHAPVVERLVSCARCHQPGSLHRRHARSSDLRPAIAMRRRSSTFRRRWYGWTARTTGICRRASAAARSRERA